jgi:hypothetical protein
LGAIGPGDGDLSARSPACWPEFGPCEFHHGDATAASELHVVMTPNATALARATTQANQVAEFMDSLNRNGGLKEFSGRYRQHRVDAVAAGRGYASYGTMLMRLKRALIQVLASAIRRPRRNSGFAKSSSADDHRTSRAQPES